MIKTIIFDNHGVLTTGDREGPLQETAKFLGITVSKLQPIWDKGSERVDGGKMMIKDFNKYLLKRLNIKKNPDELMKIHLKVFKAKSDVRSFAKKLSKRYELSMITNFGDTFDEYNKKWKLDRIFLRKKIFVSYDLKMAKPNKAIYLYVLKKLKRKPEETIFIDDNKQFVLGAKKVGINTILFTSLSQLKKDLAKYIRI